MFKYKMNSSNSSKKTGEGNTKPPPTKQISPAKKWCFTLHKYSSTHINFLTSFLNSSKHNYIFSEEKGKSGETPHLQGYIEFESKCRPKNIFSDMEGYETIHYEKAKGTKEQNIKYITKEGGKYYTNMKIPKPVVKIGYDMLRDNQKEIADLFQEDEDPIHGRKIYWFWEKTGNWGKSFLCLHLIDYCGACVVQGKNNDILFGVKDYFDKNGEIPRLIIFDVPRCNQNHVSYQAIESIKNGFFYSGKYEGGMARFNKPHILVFSNEEPETWNLSEDRWIIKELEQHKGGPLQSENKE